MSEGGSKVVRNEIFSWPEDGFSKKEVDEQNFYSSGLSLKEQEEFQKLLSGDLSDALSDEVNKQNSYLGGLSPEEQEDFKKLLSGESPFAFEGGVAK